MKLHPTAQGFVPDDRAVYPMWEAASELRIPVLVHTGTTGLGAGMPGGGRLKLEPSRPIHLDAVAADFPDLQIVMAHPAWPWQDEQLAIALHKPNTWIDLSGWSPRRFAPDLVRNIKGPLRDRVLFGTDYPFLTHEQWFARVGDARHPRRRERAGAVHERGSLARHHRLTDAASARRCQRGGAIATRRLVTPSRTPLRFAANATSLSTGSDATSATSGRSASGTHDVQPP